MSHESLLSVGVVTPTVMGALAVSTTYVGTTPSRALGLAVLYDESVRRITLITIIVLVMAIVIAGIVQAWFAGRGDRRYPGPGVTTTVTPSL